MSNIFEKIKENIIIFRNGNAVPSRLIGYSITELSQVSSFYTVKFSAQLNKFLLLGGHNFIKFISPSFFGEYHYLIQLLEGRAEWEKEFKKNNYDIDKCYILGKAYDEIAFLFIDLNMGEKSPIFLLYPDENRNFICKVEYEDIDKMLHAAFDKQKEFFFKHRQMLTEQIVLYNYFEDPKFIEEVEKQYLNYKEGENWSEYYAIAQKNYDEWFQASAGI